MTGVHNSQPQDNGLSNRLPHHHHQPAPGVSPTPSTQCPGETTSLSLLARTAATGSFRLPISPAVTKATAAGGPGGRDAPGRSPRPLPGVGCQGRGMGEWEEKSASPLAPLPSPGGEGARAESARGPALGGVGVPSLFSWGAQVAALGHPFSPGKFAGAQPPALSSARSRSKGARPPHPPADLAPSLSPTWMYAIFARATHSGPGMAPPRPLCPRRGERGEKAKGERKKRRPGGPRRDRRG